MGEGQFAAYLIACSADRTVARWLHANLEGYEPPGMSGKRVAPVLLDIVDPAATAAPAANTVAALKKSDALIVVCSPTAARARSLNLVLQKYRELHPRKPVIAVIAAGRPNAADAAQQCLPPAFGAAPPAASFAVADHARRGVLLRIVAGLLGLDLEGVLAREEDRIERDGELYKARSLRLAELEAGRFSDWARARLAQGRPETALLIGLAAAERTRRLGAPMLDARIAGLLATASGERRLLRAWDDFAGGLTAIAMHPDGCRLAVGDAAGVVALFELDGLTELWRRAPEGAEPTDAVHTLLFLGDGDLLLTAPDAGAPIVRVTATGQTRVAVPRGDIAALSPSPDGERLLLGGRKGEIEILRLAGLSSRVMPHDSGLAITAAAWSGDGRLAATGDAVGGVSLFDPIQGRLKETFESAAAEGVRLLRFAPEDPIMAVAGSGSRTELFRAGSRRPIAEIEHHGRAKHLSFSPDGKRLAIIADDGLHLASVDRGRASAQLALPSHGQTLSTVAWRRDGGALTVGGADGVGVLMARSGAVLSTFDVGDPVTLAACVDDRAAFAGPRRRLAVFQAKPAGRPAERAVAEWTEHEGAKHVWLGPEGAACELVGPHTLRFLTAAGDANADLETGEVKEVRFVSGRRAVALVRSGEAADAPMYLFTLAFGGAPGRSRRTEVHRDASRLSLDPSGRVAIMLLDLEDKLTPAPTFGRIIDPVAEGVIALSPDTLEPLAVTRIKCARPMDARDGPKLLKIAVSAAAVDAETGGMLIALSDGEISFVDPRTNTARVLRGPQDAAIHQNVRASAAALTADCAYGAVALRRGKGAPGGLALFSLEVEREPILITALSNALEAPLVSLDGRRAVIDVKPGRLDVIDARDGAAVGDIPCAGPAAAALSGDGSRVALLQGGKAQVWTMHGELLWEAAAPAFAREIVIDAEARMAMVSGEGKFARIPLTDAGWEICTRVAREVATAGARLSPHDAAAPLMRDDPLAAWL